MLTLERNTGGTWNGVIGIGLKDWNGNGNKIYTLSLIKIFG